MENERRERDDNRKTVKDYYSAFEYIGNSVASNIYNSIAQYQKYEEDKNPLSDLTKDEMIVIIEKLVEIYSSKIEDKKDINNKLKHITITYPFNQIRNEEDIEMIKKWLTTLKKNFFQTESIEKIKNRLENQYVVELLKEYFEILNVVAKVDKER